MFASRKILVSLRLKLREAFELCLLIVGLAIIAPAWIVCAIIWRFTHPASYRAFIAERFYEIHGFEMPQPFDTTHKAN